MDLKAAANAHYYQSQFSAARGLLQAALALPADASSVSNIALRQNLIMTSLLPLGDFEQSAAQLALIDAESAGQAGLQIWQQLCWAWLHEAMGDWDALRADLREMRRIQAQTEVADDEDVVEVFMRANACVGQGQFNEAERLLQTCDKNMSDNPEERLTLAQCKAWLARRQKNFDEAIRICDAALAEDWDVPMAQSVVALEREIARFADGLAPELLPLLQRLLTLRARPCLVRWRALLALQCHALGDARWRRHAASVLRQTRRAGYDKLLISREPELGAQFWAMCLVEDIDSERASAALTEIGQIEPVLALLRSAKSSQTSRAARVLAAIGHEAAIPALAEALNTAKDAATKRDIESALTTLELAPPPTLHIKLMGDFAVTRGTNSIKPEDWERPSARMLFQYLALNAGKKLTRDQIIEDLWPEADPDAARGTLKTTLSRMRTAIEPYLRPKSPARYFSVEGEVYRFGLEFVRTDVAEFERIVRATLHEAEQHDVLPVSDDLITQLLDYQPILPDLQYQAWTIALRERLLDLYVKGCGYVARARLDVNESADAARWAERAIAAAPWSEESYQSLMRAQSRQGDRALALRTYSVCAAALHHELGVPPSPLTEWLAKRLKAGEAI